ncbi:hypothetical protein ACLOJK_034115 [Asimina triloba]
MAHFSYLSSPESDNSAIEDVISQAKDLCVLEQIAALNSPHSSSLLPPHLETRFTRLKSLPPSLPPPPIPQDFNIPISQNQPTKTPSSSPPTPTAHPQIPAPKSTLDTQPPSLPVKSEENPKDPHLKSGTGSVSSPSISFSPPPVQPPSPPPQLCCFWRSPKKTTKKKKSKEDWAAELDLDDGFLGKNDEILSDLGSFSLKEQRRRLKKAWKEEEKVAREAEKIVKWAREASLRMEASAIEDLTSDDDEKFK